MLNEITMERDLYPPIQEYFSHYHSCHEEVPFGRKRIDLVFHSRNGYLTTVEVKLSKWRMALAQALVNQLISDYSYIAIPKRIIKKLDITPFQNHGVGILTVSDRVEKVFPSKRAAFKDYQLTTKVKKNLGVSP